MSRNGDVDPPEKGSTEADRRFRDGVAHDTNNLATVISTSVDGLRNLEAGGEPLGDRDTRTRHLDRIDRAARQSGLFVEVMNRFGDLGPVRLRKLDLHDACEDFAQLLRRATDCEVEAKRPSAIIRSTMVTADPARLLLALASLAHGVRDAGGRIRIESSPPHEWLLTLEAGAKPVAAASPSIVPSRAQSERAKDLLGSFDARLAFAFESGTDEWSGAIALPRSIEEREADDASENAPRSVPGGRAVVAEDHAQVGAALLDALSRCGYETEAVADGRDLVDRVLADPEGYDLLVIDFDLPHVNGAEALERLRGAGVNAPALMISGNVDFKPRLEALPRTDFLQKPFGMADIRAWATQQRTPDPKGGAR